MSDLLSYDIVEIIKRNMNLRTGRLYFGARRTREVIYEYFTFQLPSVKRAEKLLGSISFIEVKIKNSQSSFGQWEASSRFPYSVTANFCTTRPSCLEANLLRFVCNCDTEPAEARSTHETGEKYVRVLEENMKISDNLEDLVVERKKY